MSDTRWTEPIINPSLAPDAAHAEDDEETAQAVIQAYVAAAAGLERNRAFDAALRAYRRRHPRVAESTARRRVAEVLCFASTNPAGDPA
jgi:hypothetical protein